MFWENTTIENGKKNVRLLFFMPDGVLIHVRTNLNDPEDQSVDVGLFDVTDDVLTIEWTVLENSRLRTTGKETTSIPRPTADVMLYEVRQHTDRTQVGNKFRFRRSRVTSDHRASYDDFLSIAQDWNTVLIRTLTEQRLRNEYQQRIDRVKKSIDALSRVRR